MVFTKTTKREMKPFDPYRFMTAILLMLITAGCDDLIYDDLSECPQGVHFRFYRQTPCEDSPFYPSEIRQIRLFAFDENNVLVEEFSVNNALLTADYLLTTPFNRMGTFTFVAWGGTDLASYQISDYQVGSTTKEQMLLMLQREADRITTQPGSLFYGVSEPLTIADKSDMGSFFDLVSINMQELTNRVRFTIHGLTSENSYSVVITDDNGNYDFDGNFAPDSPFDYIRPLQRDGEVLKTDFILMKLAEGGETHLTITNTTTGKVIYSVDLVDDIIMSRYESGEPPYRLECDHDFNVMIVFERLPEEEIKETYMMISIWVNDWNVVSRDIVL